MKTEANFFGLGFEAMDEAAEAYSKIETTLTPEQILLLDNAIDTAIDFDRICQNLK